LIKKSLSKRPFTFNTWVFLILTCFGIACLAYYFLGGLSVFNIQVASELIPVQGVIDKNSLGQLSSTLFLIRQHYEFFPNEISILPFVIFAFFSTVGISFLMTSFKKWSNISWIFILSGILLWLAIIMVKNTDQPIETIYEVLFSQWIWLGIISLFALTIFFSNTICLFLLQLGHSSTKKESQKKWLILFGFYAANLFFSFGQLIYNFQTKTYIPGFVFWIASICLGFYFEYKKKNEHSLVIGLGFLSMSTTFLMLYASNDPGIRAIETWALVCQIITIVLFPLFIIRNFNELIKLNLPIYKVVDKPQILPTYLLMIGVLILGSSFVFALNGGAYHQITAAKYNADGELAQIFKDPFLAEINYKQGLIHSKLNAKSNTSLARIAFQENKIEELAYYLATSQVKFPNEKITIALSTIYQKENHLFESLFALQSAHQKMPESMEIITQLAHTFEKLNQLDSSFFYYQKAFEVKSKSELTRANLLYAVAKFNKKSTLVDIDQATEDPAILANFWALGILQNNSMSSKSLDSSFKPRTDVRDLAMIYNSIPYFKDKQMRLPIHEMAKDTNISALFPEIKLAEAMQDYFHQDPLNALEKIALYIDVQPIDQTQGLQSLMDFWHHTSLMPNLSPKISNKSEAKLAIKKYPFQINTLKHAIPFLSKKEAYEASLAALSWNKDVPDFYSLYAIQALNIGEIEYAKEAMNALKKISPEMFKLYIKPFESQLAAAIQRQKF
jgi:hypothetical protein